MAGLCDICEDVCKWLEGRKFRETLTRSHMLLSTGVFILRTLQTLEQIKATIFSTFGQEQAIRIED